MDRSLLNGAKIKTPYNKTKMKAPKEHFSIDPELKIKFIRIGFYLLLVAIILFSAKIFVEYTVSFCRGTPHQSLQQIIDDYKRGR